MQCPDENRLAEFVDGCLDGRVVAELEQHLASCDACRRLVAALARSALSPGAAPPDAASVDGASAAQSDDGLAGGTVVDDYLVVRRLGRGGMGEVFLARDLQLGRKVALKVLHPERATEQGISRLIDEARITARFSHPNIVTVYRVGRAGGRPYFALEYVEGQTLQQRLAEQQLSLAESLRIGLAIAEALTEAHDHGVLHRDLKPANVLLGGDGRPRVADFGLATFGAVEPHGSARTWVGSPAYMAPEQWRAEPPAPPMDIWALGVILYRMVAGRLPYRSRNPSTLRAAIAAADPAPELDRALLAPAQLPLASLVASCLDKRAERRPAARQVVEQLRTLLAPPTPRATDDRPPFRGLAPFVEEQAHLFFGRAGEIDALVERLRHRSLLVVAGPSGIGKSSLVDAGLIPRLRQQQRWRVLRLRPGPRPLSLLAERLVRAEADDSGSGPVTPELSPAIDALRDALALRPALLAPRLLKLAAARGDRLLLFVDQLEEAVTLGADGAAFIRAIVAAADDPRAPVRVTATIRDDFLHRVALVAGSADALGRVFFLGQVGPEALRQTLLGPLSATDHAFEDESLVDEMVASVEGELAGLPLLQFAAAALWERRDRQRRRLTRAAYARLGGVEGALAGYADATIEALDGGEQQLARELLLRLVTDQGTRRAVTREELLAGLPKEAGGVLDRLTAARLLTIRRAGYAEASTIELVHESLTKVWRRLARWIEQSREELSWLAEARQAAMLWARRGRRPEELWRGEALRDARRIIERAALSLPETVAAFVEAGWAVEGADRRRRQRRRRWLVGALAAVTVLSLVGAWAFYGQRQRAERALGRAELQRKAARVRLAQARREGAALALARDEPAAARSLLRRSLEVEDSLASRLLWWRLKRNPLLWQRSLDTVIYRVASSGDGHWVAAAARDGAVHLIDTVTLEVRRLTGHRDQVIALAFGPEGRELASGSWDGEVRRWTLVGGPSADGRLVGRHRGVVWSVAYDPRGRYLASAGSDGEIRLWGGTVQRNEVSHLPRTLAGHTAAVRDLAFDPEGQRLLSVSADGTVRSWALRGGGSRTLWRGSAAMLAVAVGPDNEVAAGGADRRIRIWSNDRAAPLTLAGHAAAVAGLAFSGDGKWLVSASHDRTLRLWQATTGQPRGVLRGHRALVTGVAFDGRGRVLSGSYDGTVRLWHPRPPRPGGHRGGVLGLAFSPDGRRLASGGSDGTVRLWSAERGEVLRLLRGHGSSVAAVSFSPDGELLASAGYDQTVRLWDAEDGRELSRYRGHTDQLRSVAFGPEGKVLASAGDDRTIHLRRIDSARAHAVLRAHRGAVLDIAFSARGALASAGADGRVALWRAPGRGPPLLGRDHDRAVWGVRFLPAGRLVSAGADGTVRLWRGGRSSLVGRYDSRVYWLDVHRDGRHLGLPLADGTARIVGLGGQGEEVRLVGHRGEVDYLRFHPDGERVATSGDDGTVRLWGVADGRPVWRTAALFARPAAMLTHRGWQSLEPPGALPRLGQRAGEAVKQAWRVVQAIPATFCLATEDGVVEVWVADRPRRRTPLQGLQQVVALGDGCLSLADGVVRLHRAGGVEPLARDLRGEVRAIGAAGGDALWLGRGTIWRRGERGTIAVAKVVADEGGRAAPLQRLPNAAPTALLGGPGGTLVAGFADGVVGLWDPRSGARLWHERLHGPICCLVRDRARVHAATELGDHLSWDLDLLQRDACAVMHEVWREAPAVRRGAGFVRRGPPAGHRCAR